MRKNIKWMVFDTKTDYIVGYVYEKTAGAAVVAGSAKYGRNVVDLDVICVEKFI